MLMFLGEIGVFLVFMLIFLRGIKEDLFYIFIPFVLAAFSLYGFLYIDYQLSQKQPVDITETTYELIPFDDGKIVHIEEGTKQSIHRYVQFDGSDGEFDAGKFKMKKTNKEKSYVVKTHKKAKKDSIWLTQDVDEKDYVFYLTKDVYDQVAKDLLTSE